MYVSKSFQIHDSFRIFNFLKKYPLAMIVSVKDGIPVINHIPVICDEGREDIIIGHVARANSVWKSFPEKTNATFVFTGPSAYITPSWYSEKATTHKVVPTYNYCTVHVSGSLTFIPDDINEKLRIVTQLTNFFEKNRNSPWSVSDAPETYISSHLNAIVGFHFKISNITAKWKANQNHCEINRQTVSENLIKEGTIIEDGQSVCTLGYLMGQEMKICNEELKQNNK